MLDEIALRSLWPPLVEFTEVSKDYPGYKHHYFKTFGDIDRYFTALCGDDWMQQEWAKYWLLQHNKTRSKLRKEYSIRTGKINAQKLKPHNDKAEVISVILDITENFAKELSSREIAKELQNRNIYMSHVNVWRYIKDWRKEHDLKGNS